MDADGSRVRHAMTAGRWLMVTMLLLGTQAWVLGQSDTGCSMLGFRGRGECRPAGSCGLFISGLCTGGWICCQRRAGAAGAAAARPIVFPGAAPTTQQFPRFGSGQRGPPRRLTLLNPHFECRAAAGCGRTRRSVRLRRRARQPADRQPSFFCGATLISERYMLTAAHCITSSRPINVVRLGGFAPCKDGTPTAPTDYPVVKITKHPKYRSRVLYHDLALIRLGRPVVFTDIVRPYCLAAPGQDLPGATGRVAGIGAKEFGGEISDALHEAPLPIISAAECEANLTEGRTRLQLAQGITDGLLCAGGGHSGRDACQGDSGGPLTVGTAQGPRLVGVVAAGEGCGAPGKPGLYTRVSHYIDWIDSVVYGEE